MPSWPSGPIFRFGREPAITIGGYSVVLRKCSASVALQGVQGEIHHLSGWPCAVQRSSTQGVGRLLKIDGRQLRQLRFSIQSHASFPDNPPLQFAPRHATVGRLRFPAQPWTGKWRLGVAVSVILYLERPPDRGARTSLQQVRRQTAGRDGLPATGLSDAALRQDSIFGVSRSADAQILGLRVRTDWCIHACMHPWQWHAAASE